MYGFVLSSLRRVKRDGGLAERGVVPSGCIWLVLSADYTYPRRMAPPCRVWDLLPHQRPHRLWSRVTRCIEKSPQRFPTALSELWGDFACQETEIRSRSFRFRPVPFTLWILLFCFSLPRNRSQRWTFCTVFLPFSPHKIGLMHLVLWYATKRKNLLHNVLKKPKKICAAFF